MPSFYPPNPQQYASSFSGLGNGYKDACYQDLNDYSQPYQNRAHDLGPAVPHYYNRFAKVPSVVPSSNPYATHYIPTQQDFTRRSGATFRGNGSFGVQRAGFGSSHCQEISTHSENFAPKEEKPVGGVSATLDYDMEQMTDFVSETTFGIYELCSSRIRVADIDLLRSIRPSFALPSAFRKWILQVLHATRLPSATLLLSLAYLAQRVRQRSTAGVFDSSEAALYRSLTVALILGSKFLDDNTFQNKSWAEVSHISVVELNKEEREWLTAFNHRLHQSPDCPDGFSSCEQLWISFQERSNPNAQSAGPALRPLDTNLRHQRSMPHLSPGSFQSGFSKSMSDRAIAEQQYRSSAYPYDPWYNHSAIDRSPASAQTSGPQTPEYYGGHAGWGPTDVYPRHDYNYTPIESYNAQQTPYPRYGVSHYYGYNQGYFPSQAYWNCHGAACQCGNCRHASLIPRQGSIVAG